MGYNISSVIVLEGGAMPKHKGKDEIVSEAKTDSNRFFHRATTGSQTTTININVNEREDGCFKQLFGCLIGGAKAAAK